MKFKETIERLLRKECVDNFVSEFHGQSYVEDLQRREVVFRVGNYATRPKLSFVGIIHLSALLSTGSITIEGIYDGWDETDPFLVVTAENVDFGEREA